MVDTVRTAEASRTRLVERDTELAALLDALVNPPAIVLVEGEPGVGKTRLVREALDAPALSDRQVLEGEAQPISDPYPLGPIVGALLEARLPSAASLSPAVGALRALIPERADEFPPVPDPLDDSHSERHRTTRALVELLSALGPAVLVLEDLHWTDDRTLEVLGALGAIAPDELAVVVTYRGTDAPPGSPLRATLADLPRELTNTHLHLRPLSVGGVAHLAGRLIGIDAVSDEFASYLHDRSGGIPFVVEEDVRLLVERGEVVERDGVWMRRGIHELSVPPSVGEAVVERAAGLSVPARATLEAAAVVGVGTDEKMVARVGSLDPTEAASALSEALACGLLLERGTQVVFRHSLARQAIYDSIPGPRRRLLHVAAARALEASGEESALGQLVHHYRIAGDAPAWARCAEAAADLAYSLGADATAYRYLRELLESDAVPPGRLAEITLKFGKAAFAFPAEHRAKVALLERALAADDLDPAMRGELRLMLGRRRFDDPDAADLAMEDIRAAVADLSVRPSLQAIAHCMLANPWRQRKGTLADHMRHLEAARAAAGDDYGPRLAGEISWVLMALGDPGAWPAFEALPVPGPSAHARLQIVRANLNVAHAALDHGHHERAAGLVAEAKQLLAELHGDRRYLAGLRAAELRARWLTGDLDGVEADAQELRGSDSPSVALDAELVLAEMLLERGAVDKAHPLLSLVTERQERMAALARMARASAGLLRIAQASGAERDAAAIARHILGLIGAKKIWTWAAPVLPFTPLEVARPVLDDYRAGIADRDAPLAAAALAFVDGRIAEEAGDRPAAVTSYEHSRELYAPLPDPRMSAQAAAAEGRCRTQMGDDSGARLLRSAWRTFTEVKAPWEANRVKQLMRRAGLPVPHRRGRKGYGTELSPREREVAQRAAQGSTNREIAEELFLSHRTVEYHLANARRKLHISTRRELRQALRSLPTGGDLGGGVPDA